MKIVGRIVYALVMVIFFLFTFNYAQDIMTSLYFEDNGSPLLEEEVVDYTFFYGSVPDYYATNPILSVDQGGYELRIFEVAKLVQSDANYAFEPYYYVTVHSKIHVMDGVYQYVVRTSEIDVETNKNIEKIYSIVRFRQLNLYVGVNDLAEIYIDPQFFLDNDIIQIEVKQENQTVLMLDVSSIIFDTHIDRSLNIFYENEGRLPVNNDLVDEGIFQYYSHVMNDYVHVFVIAMAVYFVLLVVATYFTYFFKPKRRIKKTDVIHKIDGIA